MAFKCNIKVEIGRLANQSEIPVGTAEILNVFTAQLFSLSVWNMSISNRFLESNIPLRCFSLRGCTFY